MAGDLERMFPLGPAGDHPAAGAYRVNPANKDQGRSAQERFRDNLERRKQKNAETGVISDATDDQALDDSAKSADAFMVEDHVNLSSMRAPDAHHAPTHQAGINPPEQPNPLAHPQAADQAAQQEKTEVEDKKKPPLAQSGRVDVMA